MSAGAREFDDYEKRVHGWDGWTVAAQIYGDIGYDWQSVAIVRNESTGELRWSREGGCSCNDALDYGPAGTDPLTADCWPEIVAAVIKPASSDKSYFRHWDPADATMFLAAIATLVPRPASPDTGDAK